MGPRPWIDAFGERLLAIASLEQCRRDVRQKKTDPKCGLVQSAKIASP